MNIKNYVTFFILIGIVFFAFIFAPSAHAQIGIQIETTSNNYLIYEPVIARVTLVNKSGYPLPFSNVGQLQPTYYFCIKHNSKSIPISFTDTAAAMGFVIPPGGRKEFLFNLSKCTELRRPGSYRLQLRIKHPMLESMYQSNEITFIVEQGRPIVSKLFGSVDNLNPNAKVMRINERKATLTGLTIGRNFFYYLVIEDNVNVYATRRIGYVFDRNMKYYFMIDPSTHIHILTMASPKIWVYQTFTPDGDRVKQEILATDNSTVPPRLTHDEKGEIQRVGGRLARKNEYMIDQSDRIIERNYNPQL